MIRHFALILYDHLGRALVLNLAWVVLAAPWLAAGSSLAWLAAGLGESLGRPGLALPGIVAGAVLVALSPASLFVVVDTASWLEATPASWSETWRRTRGWVLRVQALGAAAAVLVAALLGNGLFYQAWGGWLGMALSGVMGWLALGALLVSVHLLPLAAARPELSLRRVVVEAGLLVLARPLAALGLLAVVSLGLLAGGASGVGLFVGGVPALALASHLALRRQLQRHGAPPLAPDPRSWSDLLRPWQS